MSWTPHRPRSFTGNEELWHAITHGLGVVFSVPAMVILVVYASQLGDPWKMTSFAIYGASLVIMYVSSTFCHSFAHTPQGEMLRVIDHCSIYFLIAGTYTPFALITMKGPLSWILFTLVWGLTFFGIWMKIFYFEKSKKFSLPLYIGMGWLGIVGAHQIIEVISVYGFFWLFVGGLFYTLGAIVFTFRHIPYHHAVWHLFVLAGSLCHYFTILLYLTT